MKYPISVVSQTNLSTMQWINNYYWLVKVDKWGRMCLVLRTMKRVACRAGCYRVYQSNGIDREMVSLRKMFWEDWRPAIVVGEGIEREKNRWTFCLTKWKKKSEKRKIQNNDKSKTKQKSKHSVNERSDSVTSSLFCFLSVWNSHFHLKYRISRIRRLWSPKTFHFYLTVTN